MANLFKLTTDVRGNWRRQNLGVKPSTGGDLTKPTFTLGKDYSEACRRVVVLERMWEAVEKDWAKDKQSACPVWTPETYGIALAVAKGEQTIHLELPDEEREIAERYPDSEAVVAVWIGSLRELFPFLDLRVAGEEDRAAAEKGSEYLASTLEAKAAALRGTASRIRGHAEGEPLHRALDAYSVHIEAKYGRSGYGRTQQNQIKMIKVHVEDKPLSSLTGDRIDAILAYFVTRPASKHDNDPLAFTTCRNILITFRQFVVWLDRSEQFGWEMPRKYKFPRCRIKKLPNDRVKKRKTFMLAELKTVWQYALPWDRSLILLALNCGFSKAEIATLQAEEVITAKKAETMFIKRTRVKTDAYAEWVLWPETVAALAYLKKLHKGGTPYIVVSKTGRPLDKLTKGGNENQTIKNHWDRLIKRIRDDHPEFPKLSFKCLRKTGSSLVRKIARRRATELASMYLAHSERSDSADQLLPAYTDRPWRKLHRVLLKMRRVLLPVFATVKEPWAEKTHRVSPLTLEKIKALRAENKTLKQIGEAVGLHWVTVGKYCRQAEQATEDTARV